VEERRYTPTLVGPPERRGAPLFQATQKWAAGGLSGLFSSPAIIGGRRLYPAYLKLRPSGRGRSRGSQLA